jgi:NAD(P)H-hydrate epimerase
MKLVTAKQMQNLDGIAINRYNVPGLELMENAGQATVDAIVARFGSPVDKLITILVGPGNNGGDGLVIARLLHLQGGRPEVYMLVAADTLKGDAGTNFELLAKLPVPVHYLLKHDTISTIKDPLAKSWLVVDSLFGTGLTRDVTGRFAEVIGAINEAHRPVVAVDIPSGLCSDTGKPLGVCVCADLTVTFGLAKTGQVSYPGKTYVGELVIADIGIPSEAVHQLDTGCELLDDQVSILLPLRTPTAHKGTFGHLLIVAGSTGKTGAAMLCANGGLRCGTGLVTLCVPHDLNPIFETTLCEAMTVPLPSAKGFCSIEDYLQIAEAAANKDSIALGPGLGMEKQTVELVEKLYQEYKLPMVVDADGLNILAGNTGAIKNPPAPRILTPHPGEMSRLSSCSTAAIQNNRLQAARNFAIKNNVYVVLKGAATVIAAPDQRTAVCPTGNPGMAAGGMGDVLTGIIGGFLAQGLDPWAAACLGVYAHGLAGDRLAAKNNNFFAGYLASELAVELPLALQTLCTNKTRRETC